MDCSRCLSILIWFYPDKCFKKSFLTYTHNWPLQLFSQDFGLASHTTYVVCVNFIRNFICRFRTTDFLRFALLDIKPGFQSQARHQNKIQKVFLRRLPLSIFLAKSPRVNKIVMKSFSKNLPGSNISSDINQT